MSDAAPATETDIAEPAGRAGAPFLDWIRESTAIHGLLLALFSLGTAMILSLSDELTSAAIRDRATEDLHASLAQVIPPTSHDNDPSADIRQIEDDEEGTVPVYLSATGGTVTSAAFVLTGYGYSGAIEVLIGISEDGKIDGVRVLSHSETPGLGDKVEERKSDWIYGFAGLSLADPAPEDWKVKRDGGVFDQFSGATITPRAVVSTVKRGLAFFDRHHTEIFAPLLHTEEAG